jgi:hypothetical protein
MLAHRCPAWADAGPLAARHDHGYARKFRGCPLRSLAITAAALSCLDVAVGQWVRSAGTESLSAVLVAAIAAVRS